MVDINDKKQNNLKLKSCHIEMDAKYISDNFLKGKLSSYKKTHKPGYWGGKRDKNGKYINHYSCNWSKDIKPTKNGEGVFFPLGTNKYTSDYPWDCCNPVFVVDIDYYKSGFDNSEFYKLFGDPLEYFKDTLIVRTGKGGLHLYFKEVLGLPAQNSLDNGLIDIKSGWKNDGEPGQAFVVGFGSKVKYTIADMNKYKLPSRIGEYKVIHDNIIQEAPKELLNYISKFNKPKFTSLEKKCGKNILPCNEPGLCNFDCPDGVLEIVCKQLAKKDIQYFQGSFKKWLIFTTALKSINKFKIWDHFSKVYGGDSYDNYNNMAIWNSHLKYSGEIHCLRSILKVVDREELIDKFQRKPVIEHKIKFDRSEKMEGYLSDNLMMFEGESYAIKSPTGTGKTKLVKDYFNQLGCKFIDIVSRKSLCDDHVRAFRDEGIECVDYQEEIGLIERGKNVVIQIDSLQRCCDIILGKDIKNYVVFIDEYTSLMEHLNISPHLDSKKCAIYNLLDTLISNCKNIIVVDADLDGLSLNFIEKVCRRQINKIENTQESFQNLECKEYTDIDKFYKQLMKRDKFMFCTDSLSLAKTCIERFKLKKVERKEYKLDNKVINKVEISYAEDEKGIIVLISGDNDFCPDLDNFDRVIFSPKIIYGVDSVMEREVFAAYKENTINAKMMMQQIARCRNPKCLHFIFLKKKYKESKYNSLEDVKQEQDFIMKLTDLRCNCREEVTDFYLNHRANIIYNNDCYRTNQYAHAKYLMKIKNFNIINEKVSCMDTNKWTFLKDAGDMSRYNVVNFEETEKMIEMCDKYNPISKPVQYKKKLDTYGVEHWNPECDACKKQIEKYCFYFLSHHQMKSLFNVHNWFLKNTDQEWNSIKEDIDRTNIDKHCHHSYKLWFLKELMIKAGCLNKISIEVKNDYVLSNIEKKECKRLYRLTENRVQKSTQEIIISIFNYMFCAYKIRKDIDECEALLKEYNREKKIWDDLQERLRDAGGDFLGMDQEEEIAWKSEMKGMKKPKKPEFYNTIPIIKTIRKQKNRKKCDEYHINEEWLQAMYTHWADKAGFNLHDDYTKHDWNFNNNEYSMGHYEEWEMDFLPDAEDSGLDTCSETSSSTGSSIGRGRFLLHHIIK